MSSDDNDWPEDLVKALLDLSEELERASLPYEELEAEMENRWKEMNQDSSVHRPGMRLINSARAFKVARRKYDNCVDGSSEVESVIQGKFKNFVDKSFFIKDWI
jgi:hypothetical protein